MKKIILCIALLFIFPFVSVAQERSLYEINKEVLEISALAVHYMNGDIQYTEEDLLLLKDSANTTIKDLISLLRAHDANRAVITQEQALELKAKATEIHNNLITIKATHCNNRANDFFVWGYLIFLMGLVLTLSIGGAILGIPIIIFSMFVVLLGVIVFILCSLGL
jgi:hypothetical protein